MHRSETNNKQNSRFKTIANFVGYSNMQISETDVFTLLGFHSLILVIILCNLL